MARSFVEALSANRPTVDRNIFQVEHNFRKLDAVAGAAKAGNTGSKKSSLSKIASFKPTQLRNFSSNIDKTIQSNKGATEVRNAESDLVKQKVQSVKSQNPFTQSSPIESGSGGKVNIFS